MQLLNSCLYNHLLELDSATKEALRCTYKDHWGSVIGNWQRREKAHCWLGSIHVLPSNLAICCHSKLEGKLFCEADAKPIYELELKQLRSDFSKCSGYTVRESATSLKYTKSTTKPNIGNIKACHSLATKLMYASLDVKDWYLKNSHTSGGISAQCEEDSDDDWINSGDPG